MNSSLPPGAPRAGGIRFANPKFTNPPGPATKPAMNGAALIELWRDVRNRASILAPLTVLLIALAAPVIALAPLPLAAATAPSPASPAAARHKPEAKPFSASADAEAALASALAEAAQDNRLVLAVLGSNWCHDSTALAGWLETPRFKALTARAFVVIYIDVAVPQTGNGINQDIARRFGIKRMRRTPALLVIDPRGNRRNSKNDAVSWRNAASRSEDAVFGALAGYVREFGRIG